MDFGAVVLSYALPLSYTPGLAKNRMLGHVSKLLLSSSPFQKPTGIFLCWSPREPGRTSVGKPQKVKGSLFSRPSGVFTLGFVHTEPPVSVVLIENWGLVLRGSAHEFLP
jgi:hypothetical protein